MGGFPRINWLYMTFAALVGTATLLFIPWAITSQVYREWSTGLAISGGWNWPIVITLDLVCAILIGVLYWKIYVCSKTTIDENGIFQPSLFGTDFIPWEEVTNVKIAGGFGYHVYADKKKIVITPYAYKNPEEVIESLRINVPTENREFP